VKIFLFIFFIVISFFPNLSQAGMFGPKNYDDCILENMKGVKSDKGAILIRESCRKKFPLQKEEDSSCDLSEDILKQIDGKAKSEIDGKYFSAQLYNRNSEWFITTLVIRIFDNDNQSIRDYKVDLDSPLKPLSAGECVFEFFKCPNNWSCEIISGKGYRK
jgi:hypothetical protein